MVSLWIAFILGMVLLALSQAWNSVQSHNGIASGWRGIAQWFGLQLPVLLFRWSLGIGVFGIAAGAPQVAERLAQYRLALAWPIALLAGLFSESLLSVVVYGYVSKIPGFAWLKTDMAKIAPVEQPAKTTDWQLDSSQEKK